MNFKIYVNGRESFNFLLFLFCRNVTETIYIPSYQKRNKSPIYISLCSLFQYIFRFTPYIEIMVTMPKLTVNNKKEPRKCGALFMGNGKV